MKPDRWQQLDKRPMGARLPW